MPLAAPLTLDAWLASVDRAIARRREAATRCPTCGEPFPMNYRRCFACHPDAMFSPRFPAVPDADQIAEHRRTQAEIRGEGLAWEGVVRDDPIEDERSRWAAKARAERSRARTERGG